MVTGDQQSFRDKLEHFANLVAAAENHRLILAWQMQPPNKSFEDAVKDAVEAEREACANLCEEQADGAYWEGSDIFARLIRARGQE